MVAAEGVCDGELRRAADLPPEVGQAIALALAAIERDLVAADPGHGTLAGVSVGPGGIGGGIGGS